MSIMHDGSSPIRILALADTHLGFDLPARPRVARRRRGLDFLANFERILDAAVSEQVDMVVHGGDLFYRSRVPPDLVQTAFLPIKRVADSGIPFFIVPGNHERSRIPYEMLTLHPRIHIFDRPRTFLEEINGSTVAFAGFPYCREGVRSAFPSLLEATRWNAACADVNLLCLHHCFEGATVGTHNYTFRYGQDVIRVGDVPDQFAAVLTGHVHRAQVLQQDLLGRALGTPIMYPGAVERTSFAEKDEKKGYMLLNIAAGTPPRGAVVDWEFMELPARPMFVEEITAESMTREDLKEKMGGLLEELPDDAVVQIRVRGTLSEGARPVLSAQSVRELAPATMNVDVVLLDERRGWGTDLRGRGRLHR